MASLDVTAAERPPLRVDEHGVVRVGECRVTLDIVVECFEEGQSPEEIVYSFDTLQLADVYGAISWYLRHKAEVQAYLEERRRFAEEMRRLNESRFPSNGLRSRLLAAHRKAA